ncbi:unnamed protein product, partial [Mesorhabditis spiculigera]
MRLIVCSMLIAFTLAATVHRSKRQVSVYYLCPGINGGYISQYPCSNTGCWGNDGCNYNSNPCGSNNCNYNQPSLPYSFYNSGYNCNNGCTNVNCNNYAGQYINGQYVAYSQNNNQYSACASNCCNNYYNPYRTTWNGDSATTDTAQIGQGAVVAARSPPVPAVAPDLSAAIKANKRGN